MVSIADQPGTSTAKTSVVVCVVSLMRLNVTWETFEDVRVDKSSSLTGVGRQIEVKVNVIRCRMVHEVRTKGVDQVILPPTEKVVR